MSKVIFFILSMLVTSIACVQPKSDQPIKGIKPFIDKHPTYDPFYSETAPKLVSFSDIQLDHPPPPYSTSAQTFKPHGQVIVEIWIDSKGIPVKSVVILGSSELRDFAAAWCINWKFVPFEIDGIATPVRFRMVNSFKQPDKIIQTKAPTELLY